ncbi:MAG: Heat-inducible transcription repressor HrcA [Chloroflexota bacterium]|jgi:heat-inducible transcriptional repressor
MSDKLSARQELILSLIVREYMQLPRSSGVSSKALVEKYDLSLSPATVRNEMAALAEAGMLYQPHTSAGRVPSDGGYRYFVQRLVQDDTLPAPERRLISHQFHQARADVGQWSRLAASILARHTQAGALVTALHSGQARFKHLELIATRERQVLMVLVLQSGQVQQQIVSFDRELSQAELSGVATSVTQACHGMVAPDIEAGKWEMSAVHIQVMQLVVGVMRSADAFASGEIYLDGFQNLLADSDPAQSASVRNAMQVLEQRDFLEDFLAQALSPQVGGVQVVIAGEGKWEELRACSMVLARYGADDVATGTVGVFGPTHMAYDRAIGTVRFVAALMTDLVVENYA